MHTFTSTNLVALIGKALVDMPLNSSPVVITLDAFEQKLAAANGKLKVNCGFWAGAIDGKTEHVKTLLEKGCLGVKVFLSHSGIDEFPNIALPDLEKVMIAMREYNKPLLAHCELDSLPAKSNLAEDPTSYPAYLASRPRTWENEAIKAFVDLGKKHQCKIHIVHLASADVIPWLEEQKKSAASLTIETCPHYLIFNAENIEDGNILLKCAPPIREKANNDLLKKGIKDGIIDFLATDHSPAPPSIKGIAEGRFDKAWGGIAGLQFLLPASWTALRDELSLEEFIPLLTSKPAAFLGLENDIGHIKKGHKADITIWSPEDDVIVVHKDIEHRHKMTPYAGMTLKGLVQATMVNGRFVLEEGKLTSGHYGRIILG
jgi:allantoinase